MALPLALAIGAGVGGVASQLLGRPKPMNYNFGFDLSKTDYSANPDLLASINAMGSRASTLSGYGDRMSGMGDDFKNQYDEMLDTNSAYNRSQYQELRGQVADSTAQVSNQQEQALASRGVGTGGMGALLGGIAQNRAGEQIRKGTLGIQRQSLLNAGQFGGLATNAYQGATGAVSASGQLLGQQAGLRDAIDARTLQNQQLNAQNQNQYNQYLATSGYNQRVGNQEAMASWNRGLSDSLMGFAGFMGGMV